MALIYGAGGHGKDIAEIAVRVDPHTEPLFFDSDPEKGFPPVPTGPCYVGINWPRERRQAVERLELEGDLPLLDPTADIGSNCSMRAGVVIAPHALLLRDVKLGQHCHVNYGSSMTRCTIGAYSTIAPGVTICGDVEIGEDVLIGCGAVIRNLVKIGNGARVGTGAVVIGDVEAGTTVVGVPAKRWERFT